MADADKIDAGIRHALDSRDGLIDDGTARTIASQWHDPRYADGPVFSTTGAISDPEDVWRALFGGLPALHPYTFQDMKHAAFLLHYLLAAGPRSAVPGWSGVWAQ